MIICVCRRVSDRDIVRHAKAGMGFDDIQFELGVATQCGQCESCARDVVAQCSASHPTAALRCGMEALPPLPATPASAPVELSSRIRESRAWNRSQRSSVA
ncbi:MAG TPA: (2Fe-2S)-binding protein [Burkholderiaceae bacterium]